MPRIGDQSVVDKEPTEHTPLKGADAKSSWDLCEPKTAAGMACYCVTCIAVAGGSVTLADWLTKFCFGKICLELPAAAGVGGGLGFMAGLRKGCSVFCCHNSVAPTPDKMEMEVQKSQSG